MKLDFKAISRTTPNKSAGVIRIFLGGMFVMTGAMKLFVPTLKIAFAGQLQAAGIPFHELSMWIVPCVEISVGALLLVGLMSRLGSLTVIGLMAVATYVHLVVDDPTLFPLQPDLPIIPIVVIGLSGYLIFVGGGAWSWDLRRT